MIDTKIYAILAKAVYIEANTPELIRETINQLFLDAELTNPGWEVLEVNGQYKTSYLSGFDGMAFGLDSNGDGIYEDIVVSYAGSQELIQDWVVNDGAIALSKIPNQQTDAIAFYAMVAGEYSNENTNISITGHSLGGALAQLVQSYFGSYTVTFNAPGMALQAEGSTKNNVINYVNLNDFVGCFQSHVGETRYYLPRGMDSGNFVPHSDYINQDYSKYITLPENVKWTLGQSLALWGYDVNNNNTAQKALLSSLITKSNLDSAVVIIQEYFGKTNLLDSGFKYQLPNNYCYCIGSKNSDVFNGSIKNDTIWGNGGGDIISGGKGNDSLNGGTGLDLYRFITGDGQDIIEDVSEDLTSVLDILYNAKSGLIEVNSQILTGGHYNVETSSYVSENTGVEYNWTGLNGSDLLISYGSGDTITVKNFNNGDLGIFFDISKTDNIDKIPEQLKREKQAQADLLAQNPEYTAKEVALIYKDSNGKEWNVINCENTSKLLNGYSNVVDGAVVDETGTYMLMDSTLDKIILKQKPVDYAPLVSEIKDIVNGKEINRNDLAIQNDIYIPTSSTEGSPTIQNVFYQYTTKPSGGGLLSGLFTVIQLAACLVTQQWWGAAFVALNSGIAGNDVSKVSNMIDLVYSAITLKNQAVKALGGTLVGAAANQTLYGSVSLSSSGGYKLYDSITDSLGNNSLAPIRLLGLLVNQGIYPDKIGDGYMVNSSTGSLSGQVSLEPEKLAAPDVSTPDNDKIFELNVSDRGCPLVLDLDGDGVETLDIDKTNIYFNTQNTNFSTKTGWINGDDGLLAIDKDGDGKITKQDELFGNETVSGFDVLKNYDSNNDNIINSQDTQFADLRVWQDSNENGITDPGELKTLSDLGITSINLNSVEINQEQNQNTITGMSSYTTSDGKVHHIYNVNLAFNKIYTQYTGEYQLSVDVLDMPWLRGYGQVEDLQLKMSNDVSFKEYVKSLASITDAKQIYDKMDEFLAKWTGCENIPVNSETNSINSREIAILDKYLNLGLSGNITADKKVFFDSAYVSLKNKIYANFIAQTQIGNEFEINYDYKTDSMLYNDNTYDNLITNLNNQNNFFASYIIAKVLNEAEALDGNKLAYAITEKGYGASLISYLNSGFQILDSGEIKLLDPNTPMYVIGTSGNDTITGTDNADIIYGMDGDDILNGGAGDDYLSGGNGNDILIGGDGNDTLDGGGGDDDMQGGYGDDTYIYSGEGKDTILDERWVKIARQEWYQSGWWIFKTWKYKWVYQDKLVDAGNDTIIFDENVKEKDIIISRDGDNLVFELRGTDNKLTIKQWYATTEQRVENFVFADGFVITSEQIINSVTDTINADNLLGNENDNFIVSSAGDDNINAGKGNDAIINHEGNTIYYFNLGDGHDSIMDYQGVDKIVLANEILSEDVAYWRNNNDLIINIKNMTDSITIINWFLNDNYKIETIEFANGTIITPDNILNMLSTTIATGYDDVIVGNEEDNAIDGLSGNDYIEGKGGNDTIIGGLGKDIMKGGSGDDVYYVDNLGDKVIENINEGNDTIKTSVSYELPENVETLELIGAGAINGRGNSLDNTIIGNDNNNILDGNSGINTLKGGKGNDTYIINETNANDIIIENTDEGSDTVQSSITYTLSQDNVENLVLTGGNNINGTGNNLDNYLEGNKQDNTLSGGAGNDTLYGNGGNDTLIGGSGNDTYIIDSPDAVIVENANEGTDTVMSSIDYILGSNVENLVLNGTESLSGTGNSLNNVISGNDNGNTFIGGKGNDTLKGGKGADTYIFNLGDGQDIIEENSPNSASVDKIVFGSGISRNNITFIRQGYDLIISVNNTNDRITIKNSNLAFGSRIERLEFSDGSFIDGSTLYTLTASGNKPNLYADVSYLEVNSKASSIEREYYDEGGLKSEIFYGTNAKKSTENFYNESGVLIQQNTYNNDGLIAKEVNYSSANVIESQKEYTYSGGKISQIKNYTGQVLDNTEKYSYNSSGTISQILIYNKATNILRNKIVYSYNSSGQLYTETTYQQDTSTIKEQIVYTYDGAGNITRKLTKMGYNKPNPTHSGMQHTWILLNKEDVQYTYTNGKLTKVTTTKAYMELVNKKVGTVTYTYNDYLNTHQTGEIIYTYDSAGNITRELTRIGYDKPNPKYSGMEHVWTMIDDKDVQYTYTNGKLTKITTTEAYLELVNKKVGSVTYTYNDYLNKHKTSEIIYTYDDIGNIKSMVNSVGYNKANPKSSGMEYIWSYRIKDQEEYSYNENHQIREINKHSSYSDLVTKKVGTVTYTYHEYKTRQSEKIIYSYNEDCRMSDEKVYKYGYNDKNVWTSFLKEQKTYKYDNEGRLILVQQYNFNKLVESIKYEYILDSNGYLTKQIIYKGIISNNNVSSYQKTDEITINSYYSKLVGNQSDNILNGSNQSDNLFGDAGNDTLYGNAGNDILDGGAGADLMVGGNGDDIYYVDNVKDKIIEKAGAGNDTVRTNIEYTLGNNLENLTLLGNQNLNGFGNSCDNIITGNDGNNILYGYAGNDSIYGGSGNDTIYGGENNDVISGDAGNDLLYGGDGDDTYLFKLNDGIDTIEDSAGKRDCISFDSSVDKTQIAIFKNGDEIIIDYGSSLGQDSINVSNDSIERYELSDGSYISNYDINQIIQNMSAYAQNNAIEFTSVESVKNNAELMNIVAASWHN